MLDPELIAARDVVPRNPAIFPEKRSEIEADMRRRGWHGRPLLAVQVGGRVQALTGSHRIYAARAAHVEVQAIVVRDGPAYAAITASSGWSARAGRLWDAGLVAKSLRLAGCRRLAALLMEG